MCLAFLCRKFLNDVIDERTLLAPKDASRHAVLRACVDFTRYARGIDRERNA
jgi:hypothetical protein